MSTPPDQPSASPYSNPPSAPSAPPGPPAPGGYGTPVPAQHNPYAQDTPYGPQSPYAAPVPPAGYPPQPGAAVPGGGGSGGGRGGAGRAVLWALVGAVVASAAWGGGVLLLRSGSTKADLRGYTVKSDLCSIVDESAFRTKFPQDDSSPTHYTSRGDALDQMSCSKGLKMTGSSYSDSYLSVEVDLHKKTDPGPEFADAWLGYKQHDSTYKVSEISGFGDQAYLITQDTVDSSGSGDRYVTLALRDGWMTYSMSWSEYSTSYDTSSGKTPPSVSDVTDWVKTSTKATLAKLK
ncbi:hypothetical protein [Streptomyces sp. HPF1205]|uniref:hypothetical protein n=1 Tax=Streptomyces sp. HPF1205 TaxID=2873262 RepID=UPI001CEC8840|nr:hypothetical protein [Streptomyces sp. HPF1205]